jgi:hypothetical protein
MRVRICDRGLAKSLTLSQTANFGIAALLFLDLGKKQVETPLGVPISLRSLNLMAGFAGQSGIQRSLCKKNSAFEVGWIARDQLLGCARSGHLVRLQCQGKVCEIRVWGASPSIGDARASTFFLAGCP